MYKGPQALLLRVSKLIRLTLKRSDWVVGLVLLVLIYREILPRCSLYR